MENPFYELTQRLSAIEEKLDRVITQSHYQTSAPQKKKLVYGLSGLAALINCSRPTAQRLKNSGKIPFNQAGRKIVFDADAVLAAINKDGGN